MHLPHRVHHDGRAVGGGVDSQQRGDAGQRVGQRPRQLMRVRGMGGVKFQNKRLDQEHDSRNHGAAGQPVGPSLSVRQQWNRQSQHDQQRRGTIGP